MSLKAMNWNNSHRQKHFKMFSFSDNRQRLSGTNIRDILKRCRQCYQLTDSGKNIFPVQHIMGIKFDKLKKSVFFLNANEHWLLACIFPRERQCLIIDPLDIVKSWPNVISIISSFCQAHSLQIFFFDFKFQRNTTQICGYLCLWVTFKVSQLSFLGILKLRNVLSPHPISTNERAMMYSVYRHFRLKP